MAELSEPNAEESFSPEHAPDLDASHVYYDKHFLLVDHDFDTRNPIQRHLEEMGARVSRARSVDEATTSARWYNCDCLITAFKFPEEDATEIIRYIRKFNPEIPILVYCATMYPAYVMDAMQAGANKFIRKPNDVEQFISQIDEFLAENIRAA